MKKVYVVRRPVDYWDFDFVQVYDNVDDLANDIAKWLEDEGDEMFFVEPKDIKKQIIKREKLHFLYLLDLEEITGIRVEPRFDYCVETVKLNYGRK